MDPITLPPASASASQIIPAVVADRRPTADAAAMARDTRPHIAMPVAPTPVAGLSQSAAVVRSNISASVDRLELGLDATQEVDRTLLPYGVTMLPNGKPDKDALFPEPVDSPAVPEQPQGDVEMPEAAA